VSLAFVVATRAHDPLVLRRPLPLGAAALARLAPAVDRPGIHLGVERTTAPDGGVCVWGITRQLPPFTLVLEVVAAGLLVLKHRPSDGGKFVNLVVIEGDEVRVVDHGTAARPDCPTPLTRQFDLDDPTRPWAPLAESLVELAVSMRAHGRGGTLLVVPAAHRGWRESLVRTNPYRVARARGPRAAPASGPAVLAPDAVAAIAGLTAVDGATVLGDGCQVLAFGAKIVRRRGSPQVRRVLLSEPIAGSEARLVPLSQLGGTRHLSAAQFVTDQRDALALVASQDGHFTVFRWLAEQECVGARRVELLLV
jgi:hypothetical protein